MSSGGNEHRLMPSVVDLRQSSPQMPCLILVSYPRDSAFQSGGSSVYETEGHRFESCRARSSESPQSAWEWTEPRRTTGRSAGLDQACFRPPRLTGLSRNYRADLSSETGSEASGLADLRAPVRGEKSSPTVVVEQRGESAVYTQRDKLMRSRPRSGMLGGSFSCQPSPTLRRQEANAFEQSHPL